MVRKTFSKQLLPVAAVCLALVMSTTDAFAHDGDRHKHVEVIKVGHHKYVYRDGRFYRPGWFWFDFVVVSPPVGAVVAFLPFGHSTVVIGGLTYYHYNNVYYKACPSGYVVVPVPVASPKVTAPQNLVGERVTVNIPNSNGSYTTIVLVKQRDGYIGPQGEYYPGHPTIDQLKVLYGK